MPWSFTALYGTVIKLNQMKDSLPQIVVDSALLGNYKHFRSFVRRRRWIRLRHRKKGLESPKLEQQASTASHPENGSENQQTSSTTSYERNAHESDMLQRLRMCRLDRERLKILEDALQDALQDADTAQLVAKQVNQQWSASGMLKHILI